MVLGLITCSNFLLFIVNYSVTPSPPFLSNCPGVLKLVPPTATLRVVGPAAAHPEPVAQVLLDLQLQLRLHVGRARREHPRDSAARREKGSSSGVPISG